MRRLRWILLLMALGLGLSAGVKVVIFGLACPSIAEIERCKPVLLSPLSLSELVVEPDGLPWTAELTVRGVEELLARTAAELGQDRPGPQEDTVGPLFWSLGLSLDLRQIGENPQAQEQEGEELLLELGNIATLEAKFDFLTTLIGLVLEKLDVGGPDLTGDEEVNLVLKLEDLRLAPGVLLGGQGTLTLDRDLNFYVDRITLRLTTGPVESEMEFEPQGPVIAEERLGIKFNLGLVSISSGLVIGGERVLKETIQMSASIGDLKMVSEVSFTTGLQEFKIGATIGSLEFSSASLLTPTGLGSQVFQLKWEF